MANDWAREADLVLCVGTRLSDFTTASKSLFSNERCRFVGLNTVTLDAYKLSAEALVADAQRGLGALKEALEGQEWTEAHARLRQRRQQWAAVQAGVYAEEGERPSDAQVLMALNAFCSSNATVVCAAGGLPGELHRHWNCKDRAAYHVEYGYSCMGYEIAGGLGLKLAQPEREVYVLVGDGSYLMLHTELHTAVSLGQKISVIVLDNQGFGCINRLQKGSAGAPYGNLREGPRVDFVANARSYGCFAEEVSNLAELQAALKRQQSIQDRPCVTVIQSDPQRSSEGYAWWDVPVAEVSTDAAVNEARKAYQVERARLQGRC
jgi:3D-(3,5/4)-trihydroxycyclohexane-1,2-dione acylhydrolase (decyclizing)